MEPAKHKSAETPAIQKKPAAPFFAPVTAMQGQSFFAAKGQDNRPAAQPFFAPGRAVVQPKLKIGASDDRYEQEADAMADRVMRMGDQHVIQPKSVHINTIQRKCADCEESDKVQRQETNEEAPLMRKAADGSYTAPTQLSTQLQRTKGGGNPLPDTTLASMNTAFGSDFSSVRIHTGAQAVQMSQDIRAKAFTHGSDIYFNQGQYSPESSEGKRLLAHELTHTIQQGRISNIIQREEAVGGCGVCRKDEPQKYTNIGNEAHRIIQQEFETHYMSKNGYVISEKTIRDSQGQNRKIDLVYRNIREKNRYAIGEIKPPFGEIEGLTQLHAYKRILEHEGNEVDLLNIPIDNRLIVFPNPQVDYLDPKNHNCDLQFIEVSLPGNGLYIYRCKPPWSQLKDKCYCNKEEDEQEKVKKRAREQLARPVSLPQFDNEKRDSSSIAIPLTAAAGAVAGYKAAAAFYEWGYNNTIGKLAQGILNDVLKIINDDAINLFFANRLANKNFIKYSILRSDIRKLKMEYPDDIVVTDIEDIYDSMDRSFFYFSETINDTKNHIEDGWKYGLLGTVDSIQAMFFEDAVLKEIVSIINDSSIGDTYSFYYDENEIDVDPYLLSNLSKYSERIITISNEINSPENLQNFYNKIFVSLIKI